MKPYELSLCSTSYLNFGKGFPLRVFTADAISVSSNWSTADSGSISLQDVYTASLEKSIVHTSMPSSVWEVVSECLLRTSSRRRIFVSRVTISSFQFVAALSKAKHAFFCMFRTVLGWLARPSLLKQSISSFLQPPSTRMVLILNVK